MVISSISIGQSHHISCTSEAYLRVQSTPPFPSPSGSTTSPALYPIMIRKKNPSPRLRNISTTANAYFNPVSSSSRSTARYRSPDASQTVVPVLVISKNRPFFFYPTTSTLSTFTLRSVWSLLPKEYRENVRIRYGGVSVRFNGKERTFLQFYSEQEFKQVVRYIEGTGKKCGRVTVSIGGEKGVDSPGGVEGDWEDVKDDLMEEDTVEPETQEEKAHRMKEAKEGVETLPATLEKE
ncbi:hypothetical protein BDD12DRAFT_846600 [Trichophaea hybrida]|nr:hypothetical protein BDD12DRAFT_846600 [Trichophaea hybrida]